MLNKVASFIQKNKMVEPGDKIVCAVSGGADSVALLFAFYLLKEKMGIQLEAAHFNHNLRGKNPGGTKISSGSSAVATTSPCMLVPGR